MPSRPAPRPHRWIGTLYCRTADCAHPLAEVFADAANLTYLPQIGGGRVRDTSIECPHCGAVRAFRSVEVAALPAAPNLVYDMGTTDRA